MKTKKISLFWIILLAITVLFFIFVEVGKFFLRDLLEEYEDSQYKYVAEDFFQSNFLFGDGSTFAQMFEDQISEFETQTRAAAYFEELTSGKDFTMQSVSTGLDDHIQYTVRLGDTRFASFSIVKTGEKTKHGFDLYTLSDLRLDDALLTGCSVRVPAQYKVCINGNTATKDYCNGDRIETASQEFMPDGTDGVIYTTYTFERLCGEPQLSVKDTAGREAPLAFEEKEDVYISGLIYDDVLAAEYSEYVMAAAKAYAAYMQNDTSFAQIKKYFDPESALYTNIRTAETGWVIDHNSYTFEDVSTSEFYAYSEDVFSCRVTLTHVLKYRGLNDYRDYMDMTFYLRRVDGTYLIYNTSNNQ